MWGASSPGDKLTGDFGNRPDATSISDRGLFCLLAGNLSPGVFRLLQHNLPLPDKLHRSKSRPSRRWVFTRRSASFPIVTRRNVSPCGITRAAIPAETLWQ